MDKLKQTIMKTYEVHFYDGTSWFEWAAGHRNNGSRLEFYDDNGVITQPLDASTVTGVTIFSDDDT